jgi:hypothetical protein
MSTESILMFAIGVFSLMFIGIILTMVEFNRLTDDPSIRKGPGGPKKRSRQTEQSI